nr:hypothetical protein [Tanacetum cinerariifolium]
MAESSSQNPSSPKITSKEELITLDKPESPNPFLHVIQVNFTFEEIAFITNNEDALLYPLYPNQEYFKDVSDLIYKCCLRKAFTRAQTQYKEYPSEFWYTTKTLADSKVWVSTPTGGIRGEIGVTTFQNALRAQYLPHSSMYVSPPSITTVGPWFAIIGYNKEIRAKGTLKKSCLPPRVQIDYARLIWEDPIHKLNKKTREKIFPYPRFLSLLPEHMIPEYENDELTINPTQVFNVHVDSKAPKPSSQTKEVPQRKKPGAKSGLRRKRSSKHTSESTTEVSKSQTGQSQKETKSSLAKYKSPSHPSPSIIAVGEMHKDAQQTAGGLTSLGATSKEGDHPQLSSDESEEEAEVAKDKDTEATSHDVHLLQSQKEELKQAKAKAKAEFASLKAKSLYLDINQLAELLVTSLKPELSKLLASHDFASCLPTKLQELPSKITRLSREIIELKKHVRDLEIELHKDLKEIPTKLETFTSTISSLSSQVVELKNIKWELLTEFITLPSQVSSVQEKLKILDSLLSILHKVTDTLTRIATVVENASGDTRLNVPSAGKATPLPAEGEKNLKDANTNQKDELVNLVGKNVMTQYYTKKLLFNKHRDKMLKRKKSSKITKCEVLTKKGHITLKLYREDGSDEVILNLKSISSKEITPQLSFNHLVILRASIAGGLDHVNPVIRLPIMRLARILGNNTTLEFPPNAYFNPISPNTKFNYDFKDMKLDEEAGYTIDEESVMSKHEVINPAHVVNTQSFEEELSSKKDLDKWLKSEMEKHMSNQNGKNKEDALIAIIKSIREEYANNNVMPRSIYEYLKLANLRGATMSVEMEDMTQQETLGTVKNVLVKIDKFEFPCDFVVTDMPENLKEIIILGRLFLETILPR